MYLFLYSKDNTPNERPLIDFEARSYYVRVNFGRRSYYIRVDPNLFRVNVILCPVVKSKLILDQDPIMFEGILKRTRPLLEQVLTRTRR